jgi:Lon protease-like protein
MKNLPNIIPVFPLSNFIIFPKTTVPLNIFEERYLEMIMTVCNPINLLE